jgi:tetratricopeptide (TPR) repeat protein
MFAFVVVIAACRQAEHLPDPRLAGWIDAMGGALARGEVQGALAYADSASRLAPRNVEVALGRGQALTAIRQYEVAELAYTSAAEIDPTHPGLWYHRGHNAFLQRRYRVALAHYGRERALLASSPDAAARATVSAQIGRTYALLTVSDSAQQAYEEALREDSTLAVAHAWYSEWLEEEGRIEEALAHALRALRASPETIDYGYRVGLLLFRLDRPAEAVPYLQTVASRWPDHEGATFNLGRALQALGREAEAKVWLDRVDDAQELQRQAMLAERAVETTPEDPERWIELAGLMMRMGFWDKAEVSLQAASLLRPDDLTLRSDLANLAFTRGDTLAAVSRYEALLRRDSTFVDGWLNLGVVYAVSGDAAAAGKAWRTVLRHRPGDPDASAYLDRLSR